MDGTLINIRQETDEDHDAVRALTVEAFESSDLGHNGEAELIEVIRRHSPTCLSLVAEADLKVVGHVMFSPVRIVSDSEQFVGMGLGPMSVAVDYQGTGIGKRMIATGLQQLMNSGCRFVVVLGHPDYYTRCGFVTASDHGIWHGFDGIPQNVFFVWFNPNENSNEITGNAYYNAGFGPQFES